MKKIYVYNYVDDFIKNIDKVKITDIDNIPNGSCDLIVCDCLDTLKLGDRMTKTAQLIGKLCIGGKLIFRFLSIRTLCKAILKDTIDIVSVNTLFSNYESVVNEQLFADFISQYSNIAIIENGYTDLLRQVALERKS